MRKLLFVLAALLVLVFALPACAQTLALDGVYASVTIPDTYTVITAENLASSTDWLAKRGVTAADALADFEDRGVLCQAWTESMDACLEITAVKDDDAQRLFDINEQTTATRSAYRTQYKTSGSPMGYNCSSAEWKNYSTIGRFLMLQYTKKVNDTILYRGYARRTVRNGYTITLDYQVYGRSLKNADDTALNTIINTFAFSQILPMPAKALAGITVTTVPPAETNEANFTISGTCAPDVEFVAVVGGLSITQPVLVHATATSAGKFSIPIALPKAGFFVISLSADYQGETVFEQSYSTTYQTNLLPINFDNEVPTQLTSDKLVISGTTLQNAKVQLVMNGVSSTKTVGSSKTFSFTIDTSKEGTYEIILIFTKKNLAERRYTFTCTRSWSSEERYAKVKAEAIKPAYTTLTSKLKGYDGRTMVYTVYVTHITQAGDEWLITVAMRKLKTGYADMLVIVTDQEPTQITMDAQTVMYGTLIGTHDVSDDEGKTVSYPCFQLLFWESAK